MLAPGFLALCQGLELGPRKLTLFPKLSLSFLNQPNKPGKQVGETYLKKKTKFSRHNPITQNIEMEDKMLSWRIGLETCRAGIG